SYSASSVLSPLCLHDALPISRARRSVMRARRSSATSLMTPIRSSCQPVCLLLPWAVVPAQAGAHRYEVRQEVEIDPAGEAGCTESREHTSELQSRENLVCRLL